MLKWLLPALAVAQLAARKTLVSACACNVSLSTTTCALCVARLQTRRRWLLVSPSPSLIVRRKPIDHCLRDFPLSPCDTHRTYRSSANNRASRTHIHCATAITIRSHSDNSAIAAIHIATEGCTVRRRHFPWSDRPLQTLRAPKCANRAQLERTPTPSENSFVPSNRLDPSPAVKRRRTCHSLISLASGQQPVCHHYRYYTLSNRFLDHLIRDCQCYCSTSRHSLGQLDCRAHYR